MAVLENWEHLVYLARRHDVGFPSILPTSDVRDHVRAILVSCIDRPERLNALIAALREMISEISEAVGYFESVKQKAQGTGSAPFERQPAPRSTHGREDPAAVLRDSLVTALLDVPFMPALPDRRLLIALIRRDCLALPGIPERSETRLHTVEIVLACMATPGGLAALRDALMTMSPEAPAVARIRMLIESVSLISVLSESDIGSARTLLGETERILGERSVHWRDALFIRGLDLKVLGGANLADYFLSQAGAFWELGDPVPGIVLLQTLSALVGEPLSAELDSLVNRYSGLLSLPFDAGSPGASRPDGGPDWEWQSRVLVMGEGAVGKSSVVRALFGLAHNPGQPTTHGLNISSLNLRHPSVDDVDMRLDVWDFGGQEIYHSTHQFFLADSALYIIVASARMSLEANRLDYWLQLVSARAPGSPIVIVLTHASDRPVVFDEESVMQKYRQVRACCSVDCATNYALEDLKTQVAVAASSLPLMGARMPEAWSAAGQALTRLGDGEYQITASRMHDVMRGCGIVDEDERRFLARTLHQRGRILHYPDIPELADSVILDPAIVSKLITDLLELPAITHRSGYINDSDLSEAWGDVGQAGRSFLLSLVFRFDLGYPVRDAPDGTIGILVNRLPHRPPDYSASWDRYEQSNDFAQMSISYRLDFFPPGIPAWFLAREHRFLTQYRWKDGAVLADPDNYHVALLTTDHASRTVRLTVRGPVPARFLAVLDDGLNTVFDRYPNLPLTREISCPGHGDGPCPQVFDYQKISAKLASGKHRTYCEESDQPVEISYVLLGIEPTTRELTASDIVERMERIWDSTRRTQQSMAKMYAVIQRAQQIHCPSVFTVSRVKNRFPGRQLYSLNLYCEEPGSWHPLADGAGSYQLSDTSAFLAKSVHFLRRTLHVIAAASPVIQPVLGLAAEELGGIIAHDIGELKVVLADLPDIDGDFEQLGTELRAAVASAPQRRADTEADFRGLREQLLAIDPSARWGGLSHIITPEGLSLYLCHEHWLSYQDDADH